MKNKWFRDEHGLAFRINEDGQAVYAHKVVQRAPTRRWAIKKLKQYERDRTHAWEVVVANSGLSFMVLKRFHVPSSEWDELHHQVGIATLLRCAHAFDEDDGTRFSTYAVRALLKEYARHFKKMRRREKFERPAGLHPLEGIYDDMIDDLQRRDMVQLVMRELPEYYRMLLVLRFWRGLKHAEIGELIECDRKIAERQVKKAVNAAKVILCRAAR